MIAFTPVKSKSTGSATSHGSADRRRPRVWPALPQELAWAPRVAWFLAWKFSADRRRVCVHSGWELVLRSQETISLSFLSPGYLLIRQSRVVWMFQLQTLPTNAAFSKTTVDRPHLRSWLPSPNQFNVFCKYTTWPVLELNLHDQWNVIMLFVAEPFTYTSAWNDYLMLVMPLLSWVSWSPTWICSFTVTYVKFSTFNSFPEIQGRNIL